jgi:hypothetical protein
MPCNSDYLEASGFEQESQHTAKLIMFVSSQLTLPVKKWVMECANNYYGAPKGQQGGDQRLAPMLCEIISNLSQEHMERVVYNPHVRESRQLADWWERHQEADKQRIFKEKAKEDRDQRRLPNSRKKRRRP